MKQIRFVVIALAVITATHDTAVARGNSGAIERSTLARTRFASSHPGAVVHGAAGRLPALITGLSAPLRSADAAGAHLFLREWADLFGLDLSQGEFSLRKTLGHEHGTVHRFAQVYRGLDVLDSDVAVTVRRDGRISMVSSGVRAFGDLPVEFTVSREEAVAAAIRELNPEIEPAEVKRAGRVIANIGGRYEAVWLVEVPAARPFGFFRIFVARDGLRVLGIQNRMLRAQGNVYPDSPEIGNYEAVTLQDLSGGAVLSGPYIDVYTGCSPAYGGCSKRGAAADANGDFLYTPNEGNTNDPFAEVNAFYHLNNMRGWFSDNGFTYMDHLLEAGVNFTSSYDCQTACNAFYAANTVTIGLCQKGTQCNPFGPAINFGYDADVFMHEYTHGAVEHSAGLGMYEIDEYGLMGGAAGMNEGYADYFAGVATNDPVTGRHIDKMAPGSLKRNMDEVGVCPGQIAGESHEDGKVWASANWTAFKKSGRDPNVPKAILMTLPGLTNQPTMQDAANATLATASAYGQAVEDAIRNAYEEHGILECGREAPIKNGATLAGWLLNPQMLYIQSSSTPFVLQYRLDVPEGATRLDVTVGANDLATWSDVTSRVKVYINKDSHVVYSSYGSPQAEWTTAGRTSFTITAPQAGTYYFLPVGTLYGQSQGYQFQLTPKYVAAQPEDAGFDAGEPDSGADDAGSGDVRPAELDGGPDDTATPAPDTGIPDTGGVPSADAGTVPDTGGGAKDCECDLTYDCDPDCACDPECANGMDSSSGGCSCSSLGF